MTSRRRPRHARWPAVLCTLATGCGSAASLPDAAGLMDAPVEAPLTTDAPADAAAPDGPADRGADDAAREGDATGAPDLGHDGIYPPGPIGLVIAPAVFDFKIVVVGSHSTPAHFVVTNGVGPTGPIGVTLEGQNPDDFLLQSNTCGPPLAPDGTCSLDVVFRPRTIGSMQARLVVAAPYSGSLVVPLTGTGCDCGDNRIFIAPAAHDFGDVVVGDLSGSQSFMTVNPGNQPTPPVVTALAGVDPDSFVITEDTCKGISLVSGASCAVTVRFKPTSLGQKSALLEFSSFGTGAALLEGFGVAGDGGVATDGP